MQDLLYDHMISDLLPELKKMVTVNEPGTMDQYKTMDEKSWEKLFRKIQGIKDYDNGEKKNALKKYFEEKLYPVLASGVVWKSFMKKTHAIRIDDYDWRKMISDCENLIRS